MVCSELLMQLRDYPLLVLDGMCAVVYIRKAITMHQTASSDSGTSRTEQCSCHMGEDSIKRPLCSLSTKWLTVRYDTRGTTLDGTIHPPHPAVLAYESHHHISSSHLNNPQKSPSFSFSAATRVLSVRRTVMVLLQPNFNQHHASRFSL